MSEVRSLLDEAAALSQTAQVFAAQMQMTQILNTALTQLCTNPSNGICIKPKLINTDLAVNTPK